MTLNLAKRRTFNSQKCQTRLQKHRGEALLKSATPAMVVPVFLLTISLIHSVIGTETCERELCQTRQCLAIADQMLEAMDNTTDPCVDFYQFACGGWMSRQFLSKKKQKVTTFTNDMLLGMISKVFAEDHKPTDNPGLTKAKTFYSSCIAYADVLYHKKSILDVVASRLNLWPMNNRTWKRDDFDLKRTLIQATILGANPLFRIQALIGRNIDTRIWHPPNKLYITKPDLPMPLHHYKHLSSIVSYKRIYANKILSEAKKSDVDRNTSLQDANDIIDVEIKIAEICNNVTTEGDAPDWTEAEFANAFQRLWNWTEYLILLGDHGLNDITKLKEEHIDIFSDIFYMRRILYYFNKLPLRTQANYIFWRALDSIQNVLVEDSRKFTNIIMGTAFISTSQIYTEKACTLYVYDVFILVVYRHAYERTDTIRRVLKDDNILGRLVSQFVNVVNKHTWHKWIERTNMDFVIAKARALELWFPFILEAMDDSILEFYYSTITPSDSFIHNVLQARKHAIIMDIKNIWERRMPKPTSLAQQFMAQYYRNIGKIYITPAAFLPPFFHYGIPKSLIYAGYGSIIAHEIMRGFDTKEHEYYKQNLRGYDGITIFHYPASIKCFSNIYRDFVDMNSRRRVYSNSSLDSNIVDAFALILAYKAFITAHEPTEQLLPGVNLTSEQIFFVKYAQMRCTVESNQSLEAALQDTYSPDKFRVNGPLQNSVDFAGAFRCKSGTHMNPKLKCTVQ